MMCKRTLARVAFGKPLAEQAVTQERIAESRIMIEAARLLTLNAAYMMDTVGNKAARAEIAMIKVCAPNIALQVIDWAIQAHGGGGVSDDFPLARDAPGPRRCGWPTVRTRCIATRSRSSSLRSTSRRRRRPEVPSITVDGAQEGIVQVRSNPGGRQSMTDWFNSRGSDVPSRLAGPYAPASAPTGTI